MINWGRKGAFVGAFAFAFITAPSTTNTIQAHSLNQGFPGDFEYRQLTLEGAAATYLYRPQYFDDSIQFNFAFLTPVEVIPEMEHGSSGGNYKRVRHIGYDYGEQIDYEKRVKAALARAEQKRKEERAQLLAKLVELEAQKALKAKIKSEKQRNMLELQVLMLKEAMFHVEQELNRIAEKREDIARLAKILKDDDDMLLFLQ